MRETAFTFRCYDYLCLSVSLLKVVKQVVQSFDLGGILFPQGKWPQQVLSGGERLS